MEKNRQAVDNIVENCLVISKSDRVVVITDRETLEIGTAIHRRAAEVTATKMLIIEDYAKRPAKILPTVMQEEIRRFKPSVSIYAASGKAGELPGFRQPLRKLLTEDLRCRHGHMIGINQRLMAEGMSQDYKKIQKTIAGLYKILKKAREIKVSDPPRDETSGEDFSEDAVAEMRWTNG